MSSTSSQGPTLVNVGDHKVAYYTHGPEPSSPIEPIIIFVPGIGSSALNWAGVIRRLPPTIRSYTYDRSGYRNSESLPDNKKPTAENLAQELYWLIKNIPITNPTVIVGHSWAGVLINELIAYADKPIITGLVLVDANHETALQVLDPNNPNLEALASGVDFYSAIGVAAEHKLTKEEWEAFRADQATPKHRIAAAKEDEQYTRSFDTLLKKELSKRQPLLADQPVYVIGGSRVRDWTGLYNAGVERGNGTEEQRAAVRELIITADEKSASLMREHLKISRKSRLVFAGKSGHFVQLTEPELVVEGVEWVVGKLKAASAAARVWEYIDENE